MRKLLLLFLVLSASDLFADWATDSDMSGIVSDGGANWNLTLPQDFTVGTWPATAGAPYTANNYTVTYSPSFLSSSVTNGVFSFAKSYNFTVTIRLHTQVYSDPVNTFSRSVNRNEIIYVFNSATYIPPNPLVYITASPQTYQNPTDETLFLKFQEQFYEVAPGESITVQSDDGIPMAAAWYNQDDIFINSMLEYPTVQSFGAGIDAGNGNQVTFEIEEGNIQDLEIIIGEPATVTPQTTTNYIDNSTDENWIKKTSTGTIVGKVIDDTPTLFTPNDGVSIGGGSGEGLNEYEIAALDRINRRNEIELEAEGVGENATSQGQDAADYEESLIPIVGSSNVVVNGVAPSFVINLPSRMGGTAIDLNPFRSDRLGGVAAGIRVFVTWLTFLTLAYFFATIIHDSLRDFNQAPQTHGNEVMGSGGQITALACAALLTAAITIALVKVVSTITGDFAISSVYAASQANPFAAMGGGIVWMLDQLFPLSIIVGCAVARLTLKTLSTAAYAVCAAVIRFIVL